MRILLLGVFVLGITALQAQNLIAVQHGNNTIFTTRLDSAVILAQSGDVIYLPGGNVNVGTLQLNINKKLTILGTGYRADSSLATQPSYLPISIITFGVGSEGSFLSGIVHYHPNSTLYNTISIETSNIKVTRCRLYSLRATNSTSDILFAENVVNELNMYGQGLIANNIIEGQSFGSNFTTFTNNCFFGNTPSAAYLYISSNGVFENNVIYAPLGLTFNNFSPFSLNNNLFVYDSVQVPNSYLGNSNLFSEPSANIFTNQPLGAIWNLTSNLHLKPGCRGINAGTDGNDIGIYGGPFPFKDAGTAYNPQYKNANISGSASPNGMLNVDITVQAQDK